MFKKTKALCDSFLEMGIPGFDMIVYKDGQEVFRYFGGYSDREKQIPTNGNERYYIYSCTKPITVTCAMQLYEQGKFSLDDALSDHIPEFRNMKVQTEDGLVDAKEPIRIRNLFTMTSGYGATRAKMLEPYPDPTLREALSIYAQSPLLFHPGQRYQYGLSHDILGGLIEIWSGQSFDAYAKENVFDPLGMKDTTMKLPVEEISTLAALYEYDKQNCSIDRVPVTTETVGKKYVNGGGGCVSTVKDYIVFCDALRTGETLLKRDTIDLINRIHLTPEQQLTYGKGVGTHSYGLGMRVARPGSGRYDFGWGGMGGAFMAVDIPHGVTMFYAQHVKNPPNNSLKGRTYTYALEDMGLTEVV